jgi:hypothetical protein
VSFDPQDFFQAPDAPNTSETRLERLERLSELGRLVLMISAIEIIVAKAAATPGDPLERLTTTSRQASPMDRLRIERTIRIIMRARQAVAASLQRREESSERLEVGQEFRLACESCIADHPRPSSCVALCPIIGSAVDLKPSRYRFVRRP